MPKSDRCDLIDQFACADIFDGNAVILVEETIEIIRQSVSIYIFTNQAMLDAHPLPQALVRLRETADQHSLPRAQRLRNLQGALAPHPGHAAAWRGGHVLLVDDVSTTGATLQAAAQCLIDGGAVRVSALVLARTPPPA